MSDSMKKQTFLHGTALLALSTALVKVIGAFYSIPLKAIIGDDGFGFYSTAYEIYTLLLLISTAGLPVAMSRMISQASSLEQYKQVRKIYTVARTIFLSLGLGGTLLMVFGSKLLAGAMNHGDAWMAIAALGPACFLICLMSTYRGFFQGQSNMMPTSVSQVLEAICKLALGLGAAIVVLQLTNNYAMAAAAAILGVTASCLVSSLYLNHCFRKGYKAMPLTGEEGESGKTIAKSLLAIAVPITIGAAGLQFLTVLETGTYMGRLLETMTQEQANVQKGIYNFTQKIYNMPCAFITPITISAIPSITALLTKENHKGAKETAESAARVTALISAPCAVGLMVVAQPVVAVLGGYTGERLALATNLMTILGACIVFNAVVLMTNALLQAHGHVNLPVINMFVGGILKLAAVFILTGNPHIGILGTPIGSLICYVSITALNLITIKRVIPHSPAIVKNLLRSVMAALIMGGAVWLTHFGLASWLGQASGRSLVSVVLCGVPVVVGVVVYAVAAIALKAITRDDCMLLPKGEKIAKLLHL